MLHIPVIREEFVVAKVYVLHIHCENHVINSLCQINIFIYVPKILDCTYLDEWAWEGNYYCEEYPKRELLSTSAETLRDCQKLCTNKCKYVSYGFGQYCYGGPSCDKQENHSVATKDGYKTYVKIGVYIFS